MNYHNITYPDMNNGDGFRVVLWVSGCEHHCKNCQNPQTWDFNSGIEFTKDALYEIENEIKKDYISGLTISGGDPLNKNNIKQILSIIAYIKSRYSNKTIWIYTGYTYEELINMHNSDINTILKNINILVDGRYIEELKDINYPWAGSKNQRVIDVQNTLKTGEIVLWT